MNAQNNPVVSDIACIDELVRELHSKCRIAGRSQWYYGNVIDIYVRVGERIVSPLFNSLTYVVTVANVNVSELLRGNSIFSSVLLKLESTAKELGCSGVYVESVLNPQLGDSLICRGYEQVNHHDGTENFFKQCK